MALFIAIGMVSLIIGLLFLLSPQTLRSINQASARLIASLEEGTFTYRIGFGISLILASLLFFFVAYYIGIKG